MKTQSYASTPFAVVEGTRAVAEWLPDDKNGCYVTLDGDQIKRLHTIKISGREIRPVAAFARLVRSGVVGSPTQVNLDATIEATYERTVAFLRRVVWLTSEEQYYAVASYIAMTWGFQAFDCVPYLRFTGDFGTGKTTALRAVALLAYRSVMTSGVLRTASIFRLADRIKGTLLFDEADFRSSSAEADLVKILNCGYSKGAPILRLNQNLEPLLFDVFGPKIISAREPFRDLALESRCITIEMLSRSHGLEPLASPELIAEAVEIRNCYLALRLMNQFAPNAEDEKEMIKWFLDLRFDARVIQIALPLIHSTPIDHRLKVSDFLCEVKLNYRRLRRQMVQGQILLAYLENGYDRCKLSFVKKYLLDNSTHNPSLKYIGAIAERMGFDKSHRFDGTVICSPSEEWLAQCRKTYNV